MHASWRSRVSVWSTTSSSRSPTASRRRHRRRRCGACPVGGRCARRADRRARAVLGWCGDGPGWRRVLATSRRYLAGVDAEKNELDEITDEVFLISQCQSGNAENIGANCAATPAGAMETPLTLMVVNTMTPFGRNRAHCSIRDKTDTGFGLHRRSSSILSEVGRFQDHWSVHRSQRYAERYHRLGVQTQRYRRNSAVLHIVWVWSSLSDLDRRPATALHRGDQLIFGLRALDSPVGGERRVVVASR